MTNISHTLLLKDYILFIAKNTHEQPDLNAFAALPRSDRSTVRQIIIKNLTMKASPLFTNELLNEKAFVPQDRVKMHMPMAVSGFSDFFSSHTHAKNVRRS